MKISLLATDKGYMCCQTYRFLFLYTGNRYCLKQWIKDKSDSNSIPSSQCRPLTHDVTSELAESLRLARWWAVSMMQISNSTTWCGSPLQRHRNAKAKQNGIRNNDLDLDSDSRWHSVTWTRVQMTRICVMKQWIRVQSRYRVYPKIWQRHILLFFRKITPGFHLSDSDIMTSS